MLKIYHAKNTRSVRVVWPLRGARHSLRNQGAEIRAGCAAIAGISGRASARQGPAIDDDGLVLNESGAILQYLMEKHGAGGLEPKPGSAGAAAISTGFISPRRP